MSPVRAKKYCHLPPSPCPPHRFMEVLTLYQAPGTGVTEESKTQFLPVQSSESTGGDRRGNKHCTAWHGAEAQRLQEEAPGGGRGLRKTQWGCQAGLRLRKALIPSQGILKKIGGATGSFSARVTRPSHHCNQRTFIKHKWCGMLSAPPNPASTPHPTHTFSMSMRLLCRRFPSWSSRAFSSLICSASSGFKSNSAGNAEIQYLAEVQSHPGAGLPPPPPGCSSPPKKGRGPQTVIPLTQLLPSPTPLGRSENGDRAEPGRGKPVAAHPPWTELRFKPT